jgi:arylsulfatase
MALHRRARWNVLMIVTSGERSWDLLPPRLNVPARERLFEMSVSFSRGYAASPTSTAARAALLTGAHAPAVGAADDLRTALGTALNPRAANLPKSLRDAGWFTAFAGRWTLSRTGPRFDERQLERYGFAIHRPPAASLANRAPAGCAGRDRATAVSAARWLTTRAATLRQPWFLTVGFEGPVGVARERALGRLVPRVGEMVGPPESAVPAHLHAGAVDDAVYALEPAGRPPSVEAFAAEYRHALQDGDVDIQTVLDALRASGEASHTIVVFTSDRGSLAGSHGYLDDGPFVFEESLRVPLLIDHPDAAGAATADALASSVDVLPTLLDLTRALGDDVPAARGHSLARNVAAPGTKGARERARLGVLFTHSALSRIDPQLAVRVRTSRNGDWLERLRATLALAGCDQRGFYRARYDGRYKFARYFSPDEHHQPLHLPAIKAHNDLEIYDLEVDPGERRNLGRRIGRRRALVERLNAGLNALVESELGDDDGAGLPGPRFLWDL